MKETILIFFLSGTSIFGQSSFVSVGGTTSEERESISFSIGQVFYQSSDDLNHKFIITEGVQQPYELIIAALSEQDTEHDVFSTFDDQDETETIEDKITFEIFPNPVAHSLTINMDGDSENIVYNIYNMQGQLMSSNKMNQVTSSVDFSTVEEGIYILAIVKNNSLLKSFKIIKNQD